MGSGVWSFQSGRFGTAWFQSGRFGEGARAHSTFALVARANKMQVNDASALFSALDLDVLALDSRAQV